LNGSNLKKLHVSATALTAEKCQYHCQALQLAAAPVKPLIGNRTRNVNRYSLR